MNIRVGSWRLSIIVRLERFGDLDPIPGLPTTRIGRRLLAWRADEIADRLTAMYTDYEPYQPRRLIFRCRALREIDGSLGVKQVFDLARTLWLDNGNGEFAG